MSKAQGYAYRATCNAAIITLHLFLIIRAHMGSNSYHASTTVSSAVKITGCSIKQTFVPQIELLWKTLFRDTAVKCVELLLYALPVLCVHLTQEWITLTICYDREGNRESKMMWQNIKICFECVKINEQYLLMLFLLLLLPSKIMPYFLAHGNSMMLIVFCFFF